VGLSTALAQAPSADATRLLYERHSSRIFGFCLSRLGSREEAEDAVQTTFLNAQRGLGRGVVPDYELAWLFKIAQNVCHNRHQSARRRGRVEATQDLEALQDVLPTPERGNSLSLGDLTRALSAVPERQRRALLLREFQGLSYDEIGLELGVSVSAVETLIFRARRSVAVELGRLEAKPPRRGAIASIAQLFGWLVKGGAAPVKLAAAAAAVATTATLAIVPVVERHGAPSPAAPVAPVAPISVKAAKLAPAVELPPRSTKTPSAPGVAAQSATVSATSPATAEKDATVVVHTDPPPSVPPAAAKTAAPPPPLLPPALEVSVPEVSTPSFELPIVGPGLPVPAVELPQIKVTVTVPPLPQLPVVLPKLP
jgi:RNA polymerase sigma-70 factor (ECF subfamily)